MNPKPTTSSTQQKTANPPSAPFDLSTATLSPHASDELTRYRAGAGAGADILTRGSLSPDALAAIQASVSDTRSTKIGRVVIKLDACTCVPLDERPGLPKDLVAAFSEKSGFRSSEAFKRILGIRQMTAFHTSRGQDLYHSRGEHSVDATTRALDLGRALRLSERAVVLMMLGALFHDVGHPPFQHPGERGIQRFRALNPEIGLPSQDAILDAYHRNSKDGGSSCARSFCHDLHGVWLLTNSDIPDIFNRCSLTKKHRLGVKDLIAVLADEPWQVLVPPNLSDAEKIRLGVFGTIDEENKIRLKLYEEYRPLHFGIKELCDRGSYVDRDLGGLPISHGDKLQVAENINRVIAAARYVINWKTGERSIAFEPTAFLSGVDSTSVGPLWKMMRDRYRLYLSGSTCPQAVVASTVIEQGVLELLQSEVASLPSFLNMTDAQAMERINPRIRENLEAKIEFSYDPTWAIRLSDLTVEGRADLASGALLNYIRSVVGDGLASPNNAPISKDSFIVATTPDSGKAMKAREVIRTPNGESTKTHVIGFGVPDASRYLLLATERSALDSVADHLNCSMARAREIVSNKIMNALALRRVSGEPILNSSVKPIDNVFMEFSGRAPQISVLPDAASAA